MLLKEEEQEYAKITNIFGGGRCQVEILKGPGVLLSTKNIVLAILRGSLRKKTRLCKDQVVLISVRDFQDNKVDIIHVYDNSEVRQLIKEGHISLSDQKESTDLDSNIVFVEDNWDTL